MSPSIISYIIPSAFSFIWLYHSTQDLGSPTRDGPRTSCMESQSLNHWTAREVPLPSSPPVALVHQNSSEALQESLGTHFERLLLCPSPATCPQPLRQGSGSSGGAYWSWVLQAFFFHTGTVGMSEQILFLYVFSGESGYIGWGGSHVSACCVCVWTHVGTCDRAGGCVQARAPSC